MALPSARCYLRSPYHVYLERAALSVIQIELYIYTGTLTTDKPALPTVTLWSNAFLNSDGNYEAEIDISPFCRDYIEVSYSGSNTSAAVWIEYDLYYADDGDTSFTLSSSVDLTGLDGYGYFEDGNNPPGSSYVLQSSNYVIVPRGKAIDVPILQDNLDKFLLARGGALEYNSGTLTTTEHTSNVVYYVDTGFGPTADRMILNWTSGSQTVVNIRYVDECFNDPVRINFVNRYGAIQTLWCFGRMKDSINVESTQFKRNLRSLGTYSTARHQETILKKNGVTKFNINTGWYPEDFNVTFQELILSEQVWIRVSSDLVDGNKFSKSDTVYPVHIETSSLQFKKRNYDKLISYDFSMRIANDKINTIR